MTDSPRLAPDPGSDGDFFMPDGITSAWVQVGEARIWIKRKEEGIIIDLFNADGDFVTGTWATWPEFEVEEDNEA